MKEHLGVPLPEGCGEQGERGEQAFVGTPAYGPPRSVRFHLSEEAAEALANFMTADFEAGEFSETTLVFGDGHSGIGLYMYSTDYPEEGAFFLCAISEVQS